MTEDRPDIGKRLREIRNIFHEGEKLTAKQFAHLLNETVDRILNYENGRAGIPNHLLVSLYNRGINPTYILTGEGSKFASNPAGEALMEKIEGRKMEEQGNISLLTPLDPEAMSMDDLVRQAAKYTAAAGDIMKIIQEKNSRQ